MLLLFILLWEHVAQNGDHLKNVHHVARSQVSDTYLGRQAKFELNEKAKTLYKKKNAAVVNTESSKT